MRPPDVRFGSRADVTPFNRDVRLSPIALLPVVSIKCPPVRNLEQPGVMVALRILILLP